ncbi:MAG: hypothetical protein M3Q15_05805, partial [Pseudomonadota bacterium]|nr:hypothetical protein [Pseudomonadota bacterium]
AYIQNASRLTKTLSMLARVKARRSMIEQFQHCLESDRGVKPATARFSALARGLIAKRELGRAQPRVAILYVGSSGGEDASFIAAMMMQIRDLGGQLSVFDASNETPSALVDLGVPITSVDQGSVGESLVISPTQRAAFTKFLSEAKPDLLLYFSAGSSGLVREAAGAGLPTIHALRAATETSDPEQSSDLADVLAIVAPRILPARESAATFSAYAKDKSEARKLLSFGDDEMVVLCATDQPADSENPVLLEALDIAGHLSSAVRFVFIGGGDRAAVETAAEPETDTAEDSSKATRVELCNVDPDRIDLAMRAADLALIIGRPTDATLLSRTLQFGLPIVTPNDVAGVELIAPRISGATYDPANSADFRKVFRSLLVDADFRQTLAAQAQATFAGLPSYEENKLAVAAAIAALLRPAGRGALVREKVKDEG